LINPQERLLDAAACWRMPSGKPEPDTSPETVKKKETKSLETAGLIPPTQEATRNVDEAVSGFGSIMAFVLRRNAHKGAWKGLTPEYMITRLKEEVKELEATVTGPAFEGQDKAIAYEAADVANFAMFLWDNFGAFVNVKFDSTPIQTGYYWMRDTSSPTEPARVVHVYFEPRRSRTEWEDCFGGYGAVGADKTLEFHGPIHLAQ
jgi:hypothetical protein